MEVSVSDGKKWVIFHSTSWKDYKINPDIHKCINEIKCNWGKTPSDLILFVFLYGRLLVFLLLMFPLEMTKEIHDYRKRIEIQEWTFIWWNFQIITDRYNSDGNGSKVHLEVQFKPPISHFQTNSKKKILTSGSWHCVFLDLEMKY